MTHIKTLILALLLALCATAARAESSYSIAEFYEVQKAASGTKAVSKTDRTMDVEYILTPTRVDTGKYVVEVKKIGDNLYRLRNSDICVETRYCHEWASTYEEVVLIIDSNYGYTKGKLIFD